MSIEEKVQQIVCRRLDVPPKHVNMGTCFAKDLDADSLHLMELVLSLEEEFDISIQDSEAAGMHTFKDVVDYISTKTAPVGL